MTIKEEIIEHNKKIAGERYVEDSTGYYFLMEQLNDASTFALTKLSKSVCEFIKTQGVCSEDPSNYILKLKQYLKTDNNVQEMDS